MAILKCKMCGGDLSALGDAKIVECDFCGTTQTIPNDNDEKKTNLFNRANKLRMASEFDKASGIYENIIAEFPDESEAYWGLCLCKFGIEYVDDPKTALKIPTCHRTSFKSIFDEESFKMAIEKADLVAQKIYNEEATAIDNLQKDILAIVHKEEPFDVFICYKETDDIGGRTPDSVMAQDIYDVLTEKGLKVFFSRITLEDKLGKQYEPYIFAALNSAKVMLSIGTKEEYFNAVWVKNEWSRFLQLMQEDKEKVLIPCYKDLDPYDMPTEFKNLQGQDMAKLGFMQDLVRGVMKIVGVEEKQSINITNPTVKENPFVDRGFLALEDCDYKKADEFFEQALNLDAQCAMAYVGKILVELYMSSLEELKEYSEFVVDYDGDGKINGKYISIDELKNRGNISKDQKLIIIHGFALAQIARYNGDISNSPNFQKAVRFADDELKNKLQECFQKVKERYNIRAEKRKSVHKKEKTYKRAIGFYEIKTISSLKSAVKLFEEISDYKDSKEKLSLCQKLISEIEEKRIIEILSYNDELLSARQIRDLVKPKISQVQSRLESLIKAKKIEKIKHEQSSKYCICGYEERIRLKQQIKKINEDINALEMKHRETIPEENELEKIKNQIKTLEESKNQLSIFNIKEKKKIQSDIDALMQQQSNLCNVIRTKKEESDTQHYNQIQELIKERTDIQNKIESIEHTVYY